MSADSPSHLREIARQNIRAKMEALDLWHHLRNVHIVQQDRLYATADTTLPLALALCSAMQTAAVSSAHQRIFEVFPHGPAPLSSYRELARPSLQVTYFALPDIVYCDIDIDLGNPVRDLVGALVHFVEVLVPGKTDPLKVRGQLERDPVVAARLEELKEKGWTT